MRIFRNLLAAIALTASVSGAYAAGDEDQIAFTFTSDAYNVVGPTNSFTLMIGASENTYVDIDLGTGRQEFEVEPVTVDASGNWIGSQKSIQIPAGSGKVTVYGDPEIIDVIKCPGGYITDIDLSRLTNLELLDLSHNTLQGLDLTPNANMRAIYLSDNQGTPQTPIVIGGPKNSLMILEVDIIDYLDPNFDMTLYPNLVAFDAYHTTGLSSIDLSNSTKLQTLSLEMTAIETLDLSACPLLTRLNISESRVKDVDLTKVPKLQMFLCGHMSGSINTDIKLDNLNLTGNPGLTYLAAEGNNLTSIDLSKNTLLANLYLQGNHLSSIDLSNNRSLYSVWLQNNDLTFASLPAQENTWGEYFYLQRPFQVKRSYAVNAEIKFPEMLREGSETTAKVYSKAIGVNEELIDEDAYSFDKTTGTLVVNRAFSDSLYVEFANSELSEYKLTSTSFMVKEASEIGKPSKIVSFMVGSRTDTSFKVGLSGATPESPRKVLVDFGSGQLTEFNVTSQEATTVISGTPTALNLAIYLPEGEVLTGLDLSGTKLLTLDLSAATELRYLSAAGCGLSTIDLSYNRCLQSLNLDDNQLSTLNLQAPRSDLEKNVLSQISAANNRLAEVNIINTTGARSLDFSHNNLTEFNLKNYDNLENLDLSYNKLTSVLCSYLGNIRTLDLSNNSIETLENVTDMPYCQSFNVAGNQLSLATLPVLGNNGSLTYTYAPQAMLAVPSKAPSVNLTKQNREINGSTTTYTWKTTAGSTLSEGSDYRITPDGATRFLKTDMGTVYCEMTHPAFPDFTGANAFRTTDVTPMGAPTTLVATFTTPEAIDNGQLSLATTGPDMLMIDWRGDDSDYTAYETKDTYTIFGNVETFAGANAKVYTYNDPADVHVFSISNIPMSDFDGHFMTGCNALTLSGTGLEPDRLNWPDKSKIQELVLDGANFTEFDLTPFTSLKVLSLNNNAISQLNATSAPSLEMLSAANNGMTSIKLGNPKMWHLDLTGNSLTAVDLNNLPALHQLSLAQNELSAIDITPVASTLRVLSISGNKFTFTTLPVPADYPLLSNNYWYGSQAELSAEIVDMKVDLSSQAEAGGAQTSYRWFLDGFTFNSETGLVEGEELIADDEYTVENGVTTFTTSFNKPVQAILTNDAFPNLYLQTALLYFPTAIEAVGADGGDVNAPVNVYNLQGVAVRTNALPAEALDGLAPGIYIVAGKKVFKR